MIDHIMPETVTGWWQEHLGQDYSTVHQDFLHRLGNLTLTLENPAVKSADFETKKAWYGLDSILLNTSMKSIRIWRRFQIDQRSGILAAFCRKIWPSVPLPPEIPAVVHESSPCMRQGEIPKRARPVMVTVQGTAYPVKFWYQVLEQTVQAIFQKEPRKFERVIREYPSFFSEDPAQYKSVVGGYSYKSRFGRYQVRDMCLHMVLLVGWTEDSWCLTCE
jgi:capsid protein